MKDYHLPPTIQEMERDNPEDYEFIIYDTAMDMLNANIPYTGKKLVGPEYEYAFRVHVDGIKNGMERGTAKVFGSEIMFWHPGKGEYVKYGKEYQDFLLGFIQETKDSLSQLKSMSTKMNTEE